MECEDDDDTNSDPLAPITLNSSPLATETIQSVLGENLDQHLIYVSQWPTVLPSELPRIQPPKEPNDKEVVTDKDKIKDNDDEKKKKKLRPDNDHAEEPRYDEFFKLQPGKIGKYELHQSGKVRLLIGDLVFDVHRGLDCSITQEVAAHQYGKIPEEISILSAVNKKLLVTVRPPDDEETDEDDDDLE